MYAAGDSAIARDRAMGRHGPALRAEAAEALALAARSPDQKNTETSKL